MPDRTPVPATQTAPAPAAGAAGVEPLAGAEPRLRELGRLRLGMQVPGPNGKPRPSSLDRFRITSRERALVEAAAARFGGTVEPWQRDDAPDEWQVVVEAETIDAAIPPVRGFSQAWELWRAGGCHRRCDGTVEQLTGEVCPCPPSGPQRAEAAAEGKACRPVTRLNVLLPQLPGFGVWRVESHGWYAAGELAGAAQLVDLAAGAGTMLAVRLRIDCRRIKRPGQPPRDFVVPVVELPTSLGQLLADTGHAQLAGPVPAAALDGPPPDADTGTAALPPPDPQERTAQPAPPVDESPAARIYRITDQAGIDRADVDALARVRYGAASSLADLEEQHLDTLDQLLQDPNRLERFRAAARQDRQAEQAHGHDDSPF